MIHSYKEYKEQLQGKERKKNIRDSLIESSIALMPFVALIFGMMKLSNNAQNEMMAPAQWGILHYSLLVVTLAYFVFLVYIVKDIKRKLKE